MQIKYFDKDKIVKEPLPDWLIGKEEAYQENKGKFAIVWSMGFPTHIPCGLILNFSPDKLYVISVLYNSKECNMKSQFRISLKRQLNKWLASDPDDELWYESPFSKKQWQVLLNPKEVKRNVYRKLQDIRKVLAS